MTQIEKATKENWMALYIAITKNKSAKDALLLMGIIPESPEMDVVLRK